MQVLHITAEDCHIIDISEAGLVCRANAEVGQVRLEAAEEVLNVEEEEEHGKGITLADGKEDEEGEGEAVEHEFGRGPSVECLNPASKDASNAHGLEDRIYPLEVDSITSANQATENWTNLAKAHKILLSKRVKTFELTFSCYISENEG
jgi:hypothetical protein